MGLIHQAAVAAVGLITPIFASPLPLANPVAAPVPNPGAAIGSSFAATDITVNVVMIAGATQFGMWIPTDGAFRATSTMSCLNIAASSYGACSIPTIDTIGVIDGYSCSFVGKTGWWDVISGCDSCGWVGVGPPQQIISVACT